MRHVNDDSVAIGSAALGTTADDEHELFEGEDEGDGDVLQPNHPQKNDYYASDRQSPSEMIAPDNPSIGDREDNDRMRSGNERDGDGDDDGFWSHARLTVVHFASLPPQLLVVLTLEFLNTFRVWGFYFVIYDYATNEFAMSDGTTGIVLGVKGVLDVTFGLLGSILVDRYGVRRTSVFALGVAVVGRTLLSFGRSRGSLYLALFLFSPVGESLLNTGLYSVALKKLTTPRTRAVAFSVTYATKNLSGAAADVMIGLMRQRPDSLFGGRVFTPTRKFLIVTLGTVIASFVLALLWLQDLTVADLEDPEDGVEVPEEAVDARAMCPCLLGGGDNGGTIKLFKTEAASLSLSPTASNAVEMVGVATSSGEEVERGHGRLNHDEDSDEPHAQRRLSTPTPTPGPAGNLRLDDGYDEESRTVSSPRSSSSPRAIASWTVRHIRDILALRSARRVLLFGLEAFPISWQWEASYIVLPAFLERTYGEGAPIYSVQSINMWGCLLFPPLVGTLTTAADLEDFRVIMPGLWIMALAPMAVAAWSNVAGAAVWQVFMTLGEVVWAPRFQSWTAGLAPVGKEGLFFSVANARFFLSPLADWVLGRWNEWYVPNCEGCRDSYGHFCDSAVVDDGGDGGAPVCASTEETCGAIPWTNDNPGDGQSCPSSCLECPGWESNSTTLWFLLLVSSLVTPVLVWVLLPFFRDGEDLKNVCRLGRFLGRNGKEYESAHDGDDYDADGGDTTANASVATSTSSHHGRHRRVSYEKVANGGEGNSLSHRSNVRSNGFADGGCRTEEPDREDSGFALT